MRILVLIGAMMAALTFNASPSRAEEGPWCLSNKLTDCGQPNFVICIFRALFSGGHCYPNANQAGPSKSSLQTAQTQTRHEIMVHPVAIHALQRAPAPKSDGAYGTLAVPSGVPAFNAEASCHQTANTMLAGDQNIDRCLSEENSARDQLTEKWTQFPNADRSQCVRYTTSGGGGTYTDLLTCLEMDLAVRNLHAKNRSVADQ